MSGFLEKLERWVHILDEQLNGTTVQLLTGEVFTHDPCARVTGPQEEPVPQDAENAPPTPHSTRETHKPEARLYPPVMKKAPASSK
jgi:hypothetical protein